MTPPPFDWQRVAEETGSGVIWHAVTGSTNDDARRLAVAGAAHGTAVIADYQDAGRGRRGAAWVSPPGRSLLLSVVLRPDMPFEHWPRLTHACALAVCEAIEFIPDLPRPEIKWPNDIYLSGKKVCGLLVESTLDSSGGFAVAGAGVNLNLTPDDLPDDLRPTATSLWLERGGQSVCRESFAIRCLLRLRHQCQRAAGDFPSLLADCEARSFLTGKQVTLNCAGTELSGTAAGCGPAGELKLIRPDGTALLIRSADFVRPC
jgi:BirA family transcriptional regulator, biotin operon repressor / biotin---[acetyl-CoA-carboxylase] ligase